MTQDRFVNEGEPVVTERIVERTGYVSSPATYVEPVRRAHPGLIPLALSSLLGLLSLFLPFASIAQAFTRAGTGVDYAAGHAFSFWNMLAGHRWVLAPLLATLALSLLGYSNRASWARMLAGVLGLISALSLLVPSLFRFSHTGLGNFFGQGITEALHSGIGRWLMVLAGLGLLATALWSLLRGAGDEVADRTVR